MAFCFSGVAYLVWTLVAGTARFMVNLVIIASRETLVRPDTGEPFHISTEGFTQWVKVFFVDTGFVVDVVGLAWMVISLTLVILSARQQISVSWAWASAITQGFVAALGGVIVGYAMNLPYRQIVSRSETLSDPTLLEQFSRISLPVMLTISILIWTLALVYLLVEWSRYNKGRRGPSLADGLRTNLFR